MITILTPVFNRAHTLRRLFQSLETQTDSNFEWFVVDDGSTDDTPSLLREFARSDSVRMRSVRQENSGKHAAVNIGVREARGEWIFIVDSDDALTPDAVRTASQTVKSIGAHSGVCFRKALFSGEIVGCANLGSKPKSLHPTEAGRIFFGDLAYVFNREVMLRHPFPVIPGEKFVPELYIWNRIGDEADILFFPDKVIYLCEYLPDGYTANFTANLSRNPQGFLLFYATQLHRERRWLDKAKCLVRCLQCLARLAAGGGEGVKILLVITGMGLGGAERQVADVADRLAEKGHRVELAFLTGCALVRPATPSIRVHALKMSKTPWGFVSGFFQLWRLIRSYRPDVVHSHMVHANLLCRLVRLCVCIPRLVCTAHSTNEGGRLRMLLYRLTNCLADVSTNVSHEAVAAFEALGAVPRGSMLAVPNGIDCELFRPDAMMRRQVRRTAGVDDNQRIVLAVGRFDLAKDYPNLLHAFERVVQNNPQARLWVAGDGFLRGQIEGLCDGLGLDGFVRLLGARHDVPDLMRAADVFVLSSSWEGFGLVVAEAMASELAVVATDCGGVREVLGDAGFLVPPRDSVALSRALEQSLAFSPEEALALGSRARERILTQYSLEKTVEAWERIYVGRLPLSEENR